MVEANEPFKLQFDTSQPIEPQIWKKFEEWTDKGTSVYDMLGSAQPIVDDLAQKHHQDYNVLPPFKEFKDFREAMARNWFAKVVVFRHLTEQNGFQRLQNVTEDTLNDSTLTLLTKNASTVLFGPGAFDTKGEGANFVYSRMGLRWSPTIQSEGIDEPSRRFLRDIPQVGQRLPTYIKNPGPEVTAGGPLSVIIAAYYLPRQSTIGSGDLQQQITHSFNEINKHTLPSPQS